MNEVRVKVHPNIGFDLVEWKLTFGQVFLYRLNNKDLIFRPLTIKECEAIYKLVNFIDEWVLDEWVVKTTLLTDNIDYILNDAPAGLCASLAASVLKHSTMEGPENIITLLEKERESASSVSSVIDNMVKLGAGHFLKDTKNITYKQQIGYLAFAEYVTGNKINIVTQTLPKNKSSKKLPPEVATILSKEAADIPDIARDNALLRET